MCAVPGGERGGFHDSSYDEEREGQIKNKGGRGGLMTAFEVRYGVKSENVCVFVVVEGVRVSVVGGGRSGGLSTRASMHTWRTFCTSSKSKYRCVRVS